MDRGRVGGGGDFEPEGDSPLLQLPRAGRVGTRGEAGRRSPAAAAAADADADAADADDAAADACVPPEARCPSWREGGLLGWPGVSTRG